MPGHRPAAVVPVSGSMSELPPPPPPAFDNGAPLPPPPAAEAAPAAPAALQATRSRMKSSVGGAAVVVLEPDSPIYRYTLEMKHDSSIKFEEDVDQMVELTEAYIQQLGSGFSAIVNHLSGLIGSKSRDLGEVDFVSVLSGVESHVATLQMSLENTFIRPLQQYRQLDLSLERDMYKSFNRMSDEFDKATFEFTQMKKDTDIAILNQAEKQLKAKRLGLELARFDMMGVLEDIEERRKFFWEAHFCSLSDAHLAYHQLSSQQLLAVQDDVAVMRAKVEAAEQELSARIDTRQEGHDFLARLERRANMSPDRATTLYEGYMYKQSFALTEAKAKVNSFSRWNKRWFVLKDNGMLYYYGDRNDSKPCKMPIDMHQVTELQTDSDKTCEFIFHFGGRVCSVKGLDQPGKKAWMEHMQSWLDEHADEQQAFQSNQAAAFSLKGTGVRDIDAAKGDKTTVVKQGFLFKQEDGRMARWKKRWCVLDQGALHYYDDWKSMWSAKPTDTINLLTATVKEDRESHLRFVFKVITPQSKDGAKFQATSQEEFTHWMLIIQNAIMENLNALTVGDSARGTGSRGHDAEQQQLLEKFRGVAGNACCADCGEKDTESLTWASINLGCMLCLDCSGVHRSMGTHISKVRSVVLDVKQWTPELQTAMFALGNDYVNSLWEAELGEFVKPVPEDVRETKETYIRAKYETKQLLASDGSSEAERGARMISAAQAGDLKACYALAIFDTHRWTDQHGRTVLHYAATAGHVEILELLILSGADVDVADEGAMTPLHAAVASGHENAVRLLMAKHAKVSAEALNAASTSESFDQGLLKVLHSSRASQSPAASRTIYHSAGTAPADIVVDRSRNVTLSEMDGLSAPSAKPRGKVANPMFAEDEHGV